MKLSDKMIIGAMFVMTLYFTAGVGIMEKVLS